jgi:hypothetical protein
LENKIRELELQKGRLERESREVSYELVDLLSERSSWKKKKKFFQLSTNRFGNYKTGYSVYRNIKPAENCTQDTDTKSNTP